MTATGHAAVGALIAARFTNPLLIFLLAFLSHFLCDLVPHWDSGTHWKEKSNRRLFFEAIFDVLFSILVAFVIFRYYLNMNNYLLLYLSVFAAQLPDWLSAPFFILHLKHPFFRWASSIQGRFNRTLDKPWGIFTQVAAIFILYFVLFKVL